MTATEDKGPSIFFDKLTVTLVLQKTEQAIIRLSDSHGQIVRMYGIQVTEGLFHLELDNLGKLPEGKYRLQIMTLDGSTLFRGQYLKG